MLEWKSDKIITSRTDDRLIQLGNSFSRKPSEFFFHLIPTNKASDEQGNFKQGYSACTSKVSFLKCWMAFHHWVNRVTWELHILKSLTVERTPRYIACLLTQWHYPTVSISKLHTELPWLCAPWLTNVIKLFLLDIPKIKIFNKDNFAIIFIGEYYMK